MQIKIVKFTNPTDYYREDYSTATIPFRKGEWFGNTEYLEVLGHNNKLAYHLLPFGPRYEDNSVRYASFICPLQMSSWGEKHIVVKSSKVVVKQPKFILKEDLQKRIFELDLEFLTFDSEVRMVPLTPIEDNNARKVTFGRKRLGDNLWVEMYLYFYSGQDYVPFECRIIGSNPEVIELGYTESDLVFWCNELISIYGWKNMGMKRNSHNFYMILPGENIIGDGQSISFFGNIYFPGENDVIDLVPAYLAPVKGVCLNWKDVGNYGPFGVVPNLKGTQEEIFNASREKYARHLRRMDSVGSPWEEPEYGVGKKPGASGAKNDFGNTKLLDVVSGLRPELLEVYYFNAIKDNDRRPTHIREIDGSFVTREKHPKLIFWNGRTHYHHGVSIDRLGKTEPSQVLNSNEWNGKDDEHWSSNILNFTTLLHYTYMLRDELKTEGECYLLQNNLPSEFPNYPTTGIGASRAVGRVLRSMAQNYLITGNEAIKKRMNDKINEVLFPWWPGKETSPRKPLDIRNPDYRLLPEYHSILCYQEGMAIPGLEAAFRVTGNEKARIMAYEISKSLILYGYVIKEDRPVVGEAARWFTENPGMPLTKEQYNDTTRTYWKDSTGVDIWALPAVVLFKSYMSGNEDIDLVNRVNKILNFFYSSYSSFKDYNEFIEWVGITG